MPDDLRAPVHDRRRFVARLAATLAAGFGVAAATARPAGAADCPPGMQCGIYCYLTSGGCGGCSGGNENHYQCYDHCWGWYYMCLPRSSYPCSNFCYSCPC